MSEGMTIDRCRDIVAAAIQDIGLTPMAADALEECGQAAWIASIRSRFAALERAEYGATERLVRNELERAAKDIRDTTNIRHHALDVVAPEKIWIMAGWTIDVDGSGYAVALPGKNDHWLLIAWSRGHRGAVAVGVALDIKHGADR